YATLTVKKIYDKGSQPIRNKDHPPEFKKYRKSLRIIKALDKADYSKKTEDIQELTKLICTFNKQRMTAGPIVDHSQQNNTEEIDWNLWRKEIKEAIRTLKETCILKENKLKLEKINAAILQRCIDIKDNQKKMISSLTNNFKASVKIDRILVTDNLTRSINQTSASKYISTQPQVIKQQVEDYYSKAFQKRKTNFNSLSEEWKNQYNPRHYIDSNWFNDLSKKPDMTELEDILKALSTNKASGPFGISYEMLKKLKTKGKKILIALFNTCFTTGIVPHSWKNSNIYPIPKKEDWMADLSNTRPIVLMETTRKCFTKILTNRLSLICKEKHVLRGPNFAGLPGESTQEPIQLLNSICEEAREQNKELWILFQDTAKAFDTVNLQMLHKALARIKIPKKTISLLLSLFQERKFQVITDNGLTDPIIAGDSIDQGETISPLLWRIFYDPLLCKIQDNKKLGYIMQCTWQPNMTSQESNKLEFRSAAIAYMDDTTWVSYSKQNLQMILEDAREFY